MQNAIKLGDEDKWKVETKVAIHWLLCDGGGNIHTATYIPTTSIKTVRRVNQHDTKMKGAAVVIARRMPLGPFTQATHPSTFINKLFAYHVSWKHSIVENGLCRLSRQQVDDNCAPDNNPVIQLYVDANDPHGKDAHATNYAGGGKNTHWEVNEVEHKLSEGNKASICN